MKNSRFYLLNVALIALLFAGCESNGISHRISEKSAVFANLSPEQKQSIENGLVSRGYTPDMTYMALGKPTSIETKQVDENEAEMWVYRRFYPSGEMEEILTGYSRDRNPNLQRSLNLETGKATVNVNAPGSSPGLGATATGQGNDLSLPDLPVYNLYVFFQGDQVVDIKLDSLDGTSF